MSMRYESDSHETPSHEMTHDAAPRRALEIGATRRAIEDERLVRGEGQYVADLQLPGTLHVAFVRASHAHARLRAIGTTSAAAAPGVVAILTASDLPVPRTPARAAGATIKAAPPPFLASEVVHAVGEPILAIVADTPARAVDAAALVEIDYDPLPAVTDPEAALQADALLVHPELGTNLAFTLRGGEADVDRAFAGADRVVSIRMAIPRLAGVPLEPLGILAAWDEAATQLTIWCTTQAPWRVHAALTEILGLAPTALRVVSPDVGGGFGVRGPVFAEYVVAALAARRLGRPVRWIATRSEDFLVTQSSRETIVEASLAATNDGELLGLRAHAIVNLGAYATWFGPAQRIVALLTGAYQIPAASVEVSGVYTNTGVTGAYRGAGRPEAAFVIERLIEELAGALGTSAIELRRRNFVPPDAFPYRNALGATYDSGQYALALERAIALADHDGIRREQQARLAAGNRSLLGIGVMSYVEPTGGGWESGRVRIEPDGQVVAISGSVAHGQSHRTTFAQIVADRLGARFEDVELRQGDTADNLPGIGTFGSRSTALGGGALTAAADEVYRQARQIAAHLLEAAADDVVARDGRFSVVGVAEAGRSVSWRDVARAAAGGQLPANLSADLDHRVQFDMHGEAFAFGTCVAIVTVDQDTGIVRLERLVLVHDCGTPINPRLVAAQLHGGLTQGVGEALGEWLRFDDEGQLLTGSLMDYWIPHADDVPSFALDETRTPSPLNPIGAKGVGEAGTIAAPSAILHAVMDALRPLGVQKLDMPLTPERVWQAIRAAAVSAGGRREPPAGSRSSRHDEPSGSRRRSAR